MSKDLVHSYEFEKDYTDVPGDRNTGIDIPDAEKAFEAIVDAGLAKRVGQTILANLRVPVERHITSFGSPVPLKDCSFKVTLLSVVGTCAKFKVEVRNKNTGQIYNKLSVNSVLLHQGDSMEFQLDKFL